MSRKPGELVVRPLFFEALSGEFAPPSDILGRKHTLGRLAFATFLRGNTHSRIKINENLFGISYDPTWTSNVKAIVFCEKIDEKLLILSGVSLSIKGNNLSLAIDDDTDGIAYGFGTPAVGIHSSYYDIETPLEPIERLDNTKNVITQAAQDFFADAHRIAGN